MGRPFPKSDVRAWMCCAAALLVVAAVRWTLLHRGVQDEVRLDAARADSVWMATSGTETGRRARQNTTAARKQPFPFDPNHADSLTLLEVGFAPWQVRNMLKYRRKGGRWRSPDDLARLYGLSDEDFRRLRPYVRIAPADRPKAYVREESYGRPLPAMPKGERMEKYAEGTKIPLNEADTTMLKHIPGIGSYYAGKIVRYRERLGGFVSLAQLAEVEGLPAGIVRWFELGNGPAPKRVHLNKASFKELVRHPYLNYEQTKCIVNHIRQYGPIHSWRELRLYKDFSAHDFERLTPYFSLD